MPQTFFHAAPIPLAVGSVIEPGNWGRIMRAIHWGAGIPPYFLREMTFEAVRLRDFPSRPSRFDALFVFEQVDHLPKITSDLTRRDITYEVELVSPEKLSHRGDFDVVRWPNSQEVRTIPFFEEMAAAYWRSENPAVPELVTLSAARIVRRL
jgi:hypothetical protein